MLTYIEIGDDSLENYPFLSDHESILLIDIHEVSVYIGQHDHIMVIK